LRVASAESVLLKRFKSRCGALLAGLRCGDMYFLFKRVVGRFEEVVFSAFVAFFGE